MNRSKLHRKQTTVAALTFSLAITANLLAADKTIVQTAVDAGSFNTLAAALKAADLVNVLQGAGPFTVFAPTDEAFAQLPPETLESLLKPENKSKLASILKYHVVTGKVASVDVVKLSGATTLNGQRVDIETSSGKVSIDGANVTKTDIVCSNGIIHVVDRVLMPETNRIPAVAKNAGGFSTLLAAAKAAGLVDALAGDQPLTVFAPTDDAFARLPDGTVNTLLRPENREQLQDLLKYHVVAGRLYSTNAVSSGTITTLQGASVAVSLRSGAAFVDEAKLVSTDIDASNGVIHVIDTVLTPQTRQQAASPRHMIEQAIAKGAPLYNAGHTAACASLYMATAKQMLALDDNSMCAQSTHTLQAAVKSAEACQCVDTQAWTLRHAMDAVYANLR